MKGLQLKIIIAVCTLFIGIGAVILFINNFQRAESDPTVYTVSFSELVNNPERYDGKLVHVSGVIMGLGIDTQTYLVGASPEKAVYFNCKGEFCAQMYVEARSIQRSDNYSLMAGIDMIGRFREETKLPEMLAGQETSKGMFLEITELKGIEAVKIR